MRIPSPSPSVASEDAESRARQQEEEEHRMRLQLYVFVIRCIAYPFVAKQPTDLVKRQVKVMTILIVCQGFFLPVKQ